jgi:hypothetical protein
MSTFLQDFRYAWRQLYKNRGVSLTAILSLTLGIGATVSVFSIIYAVLMNPWPYQGPESVVLRCGVCVPTATASCPMMSI